MSRKSLSRRALAVLACVIQLYLAPPSYAGVPTPAHRSLRSSWNTGGMSSTIVDRAGASSALAAGRSPVPARGMGVPDASGGMYYAWVDYRDGNGDIYVTRIASSGVVASGWPLDGVPVCTAPGDQGELEVKPDGSGGAIVAWLDGRDSLMNDDAYARIDWSKFSRLPAFAEANRINAYGTYLRMEQEELDGKKD